LERALKRFEGQVQLVLYYPFALNPASEAATQAALCAGEQGKFWEFHHLVYLRQAEWSHANDPLVRLQDMAKNLQVDPVALKSCVQSRRMLPLIEADRTYARSLEIRSTPTLFINEKRIVGAESEGDLVRTIRQELERVRRSTQ
jgi:protein-disulfide isomerase